MNEIWNPPKINDKGARRTLDVIPRILLLILNIISTNAPLLYPLETSENLRFPDVFGGYRSGTLVENGLNIISFAVLVSLLMVLNMFFFYWSVAIVLSYVVWLTQTKSSNLKYLDLANFGKLATNVRGCEHELKKCTGKLKKMFWTHLTLSGAQISGLVSICLERVNNTSKGASMSAVIRNCNCELAETSFHNVYIIYIAGIFSD